MQHQVLIVDDSLSMRHVLSVAVKKAGWTPIPARDGLEALDLLGGVGRRLSDDSVWAARVGEHGERVQRHVLRLLRATRDDDR